MPNLAFILLFLLKWSHPTLSAFPCEFIPKEMEKSRQDFQADFKKIDEEILAEMDSQFQQNPLWENVIKNSLQILKEFPQKIEEMKREVIKYLENENGNYKKISGELNHLIKIVKKLKINAETMRREMTENENEVREMIRTNVEDGEETKMEDEKQIEIVDKMIGLLDKGNEILVKVKVELETRMPFENFVALKKEIEKEKAKMEKEIDDEIFKNKLEKAFQKMRQIIKEKKEELREEFKHLHLDRDKGNLEENLKENLEILEDEIFSEKPTLEKVKFDENKMSLAKIKNGAKMEKMIKKIKQMQQKINEAVEKIPKSFLSDYSFIEEMKKYADLEKVSSMLQYMNSASNEMYINVEKLVSGKIDENMNDDILANIHLLNPMIIASLRMFQEEEEEEDYIKDQERLEEKELPKEWYIYGKGGNSEEMGILIAQNLLFIEAKLNGIYKFADNNEEEKKKELLGKSVHLGMLPKNVGLYIYQKLNSILPCKFILKEMEEFLEIFKGDIVNYENEKILKFADSFNFHSLDTKIFTDSLKILENMAKKIEKRTKVIINYLKEEKGNYKEIAGKLDEIKISSEKMAALKGLKSDLEKEKQMEIKEQRKEKQIELTEKYAVEMDGNFEGKIGKNVKKEIPIEKRLELVQHLIGLLERGNGFVDKLKVELRTRMPFGNYLSLKKEIEKEKAKMEKEIEKIFNKNEKEAIFEKIEMIIEAKRKNLHDNYRKEINILPKDSPKCLKENLEILDKQIYGPEKYYLEKVKLEEMSKIKNEEVDKIIDIIKQMGKQIDGDVEEMPKLIVEAFVHEFMGISKNDFYDLLFLKSANKEMYNFIWQIVYEKLNNEEKTSNLAKIYLLERHITPILAKNYKIRILYFKELKEKELSKEWLMEEENGETVEKMTILSAKNIYFIITKLKENDEEISKIFMGFAYGDLKGKMNLMEIKKLIQKGMAQYYKIGQKYYREYLEAHKALEVASLSSSTNVKKIDEKIEKMLNAMAKMRKPRLTVEANCDHPIRQRRICGGPIRTCQCMRGYVRNYTTTPFDAKFGNGKCIRVEQCP